MRLNQFIALTTGMSRRAADAAIADGRISVNGELAMLGQQISDRDTVILDKRAITPVVKTQALILNKPVGYVCSRNGQGSKTIYDLLPAEYHRLKPVGRLDKDSSGLLLVTDDGQFAHELTHPSFEKTKVYEIELNKNLSSEHLQAVSQGVELEEGMSCLELEQLDQTGKEWNVSMHEGRNRQIRRTFEALGYNVVKLHRTQFGPYKINDLPLAKYAIL